MAISQLRSRRKPSGGRYKDTQAKKLAEKGRQPMFTRIDPIKTKVVGGRGSTSKRKALTISVANVYVPKKKAYEKAELKTVLENAANRNYIRRNIITKGTVVETSLGKAKITNRPSQEGCVNAILLD